jgi:hypothetical protein
VCRPTMKWSAIAESLRNTALNIINNLIFAMEKLCVLFEVRTDFLNIIHMSFGFKGLMHSLDTLYKCECHLRAIVVS